MAAPNLSMTNTNVTTPAGAFDRHRLTIRAGTLIVRDRRSSEVFTAEALSWEKGLNGLVTIHTDLGDVVAKRAGCGCGGR
ncbi:MAG TPA: hypothetical protein VMX12_13140 [Acidimicrobiia bacterium]|nr:hypothetical protein [Acidimicrobiia bacterium]